MTILYVQHDYAVFGFGETEEEAIAMAAQWLAVQEGAIPLDGAVTHFKRGCEAGKGEF
jgi:hypothetical protein